MMEFCLVHDANKNCHYDHVSFNLKVIRIYFPGFCSSSPSLIQKLQTIQNSALRIATGCVKMASIDHLYEETEMLPVQDHLFQICSQHLARALQPNNPSHSVVTSPSGSRDMKPTLQSRFLHHVNPHLSSGILTPHRLWDHHQVPTY